MEKSNLIDEVYNRQFIVSIFIFLRYKSNDNEK